MIWYHPVKERGPYPVGYGPFWISGRFGLLFILLFQIETSVEGESERPVSEFQVRGIPGQLIDIGRVGGVTNIKLEEVTAGIEFHTQ